MAILRYPLVKDVGYNYPGKITFQIYDEQEGAAAIRNTLEALVNTTSDERSFRGIRETVFNSEPPINFDLGACTLYLPQAIQFRDGAEYQNIELGVLGAATEAGITRGNSFLSSVASASAEELGSLVDAVVTGNSQAANLAAVRAANKLGDRVAGGVASATRLAVNPNTRSLFRAVALREFAFTFKMIASSAEEAESIKEIIRFFRENMYPEEIPVADGFSVGYIFPARFKIGMYYGRKQVATKLLPAYLRDVSVTYNSSSMGFHSDGNFTEVDVNLAFTESRALTKREIGQGY